jgi:glycosyltransferase involved in cell wall biosynthesis
MRIAFLTGYPYQTTRYGVSEHVYQLTNSLSQIGIDIHIVTFENFSILEKKTDHLWLHVIKKKFLYYIIPWSSIIRLRRELKNISPDVIHLHGTTFPYSLAAWSFRKKIPVVVTLHGNEEEELKYQPFLLKLWVKYFLIPMRNMVINSVTALIVCSQALQDQTRGLTKKPIFVILNGVNPGLFFTRTVDEALYLLFIGTLSKRKGVDLLIRAMPEVIKKVGSVQLKIAGDGPEENALKTLADELQVTDHITFLGYVFGQDKIALIQNASVMIQPSRFEGTPLTILEAQACGKAIIASRAGGIPELIIDKETGLLFDVDDLDQLIDHIVTLILDPQIRRKLGKAAHHRSKLFSWDNVAKQVIAIYEFSKNQFLMEK